MNLNVFTFSGNVGQDPEVKYLKEGTPVLTFSVAVNTGYGDNQTTFWVNVNKFGKGVESLSSIITKGMKVSVSGKLKITSKKNQDGIEKQYVNVDADLIDLPQKGDSKTSEHQQAKQNGYAPKDEDIPF